MDFGLPMFVFSPIFKGKTFKRFNTFNEFKRLEIFVCRCWCFHQIFKGKTFKRFNTFNKFKRLEIFVCRCWCFHQSSKKTNVQKVGSIFQVFATLFSKKLRVLASLCLCVFVSEKCCKHFEFAPSCLRVLPL